LLPRCFLSAAVTRARSAKKLYQSSNTKPARRGHALFAVQQRGILNAAHQSANVPQAERGMSFKAEMPRLW
jgi:hypothetical protein